MRSEAFLQFLAPILYTLRLTPSRPLLMYECSRMLILL